MRRRSERGRVQLLTAYCLVAAVATSAALPGCGSAPTGSAGAAPEPAKEKSLNDVPTAAWSITYRDGSANAFFFAQVPGKEATFEYDPVKPEESGTGQYSGGSPNSGTLTAALTEELWRRVLELESNKSVHQEDRDKGTGQFFLDDGSNDRSFVVEMGPVLDEFNEFMKQFRAR